MGTEFWHPGSRDMSEHFERERRESEKLVLDALGQIRADTAEVNRKTGEMYTALFGPASMPHMGFIPRTDNRLDELDNPKTGRVRMIEKRMWLWIGALSVLVPASVWGLEKLLR